MSATICRVYNQPHPPRLTRPREEIIVRHFHPSKPLALKTFARFESKMHFSNTLPLTSALLLSLTPLVQADDFDAEDVPKACVSICQPIRDLVRACDVDDDAVGGDRNEDLLERQCICENRSFDVANVAGQCQGCIEQNYRNGCGDHEHDDDDDDDDHDECDGREGML